MAQLTQTISPLRQRMIDDMRLRKLSPKTQTGYIRAVRQLAGFLGRSPDSATVEELRRYQLHLVDHGVSPVSLNATLTGLKFFFEVAAETVHTIAADPRHLGSRIGLTLVLHTWGSALTHHPHVHGIVPGGGLIANAGRRDNLARVRELLNVPSDADDEKNAGDAAADPLQPTYVRPDCGAPMIIIETLVRGQPIRAPPKLRGTA